MYMYSGTDTKKQYAMMFICIIIGVAIGAAVSGGKVITVNDTDRVVYNPQVTYTGEDAVNLYHSITGNQITDAGYDRCTMKSFNTYTIEANLLEYSIAISGGAQVQVYILKENATDPSNYVILDQYQISENFNGQISFLSGDVIDIIMFYLNVRTIVISGILSHG
jgi:hypothetical protein